MIKQIKITNYQSHKNTTIQFKPGLNCIVASSDVGKSALIRALRWTLFNNIYSKTITWGQKESRVELDLFNGNKIIREKGNKSLNRYTVIKDGQETIFNNFGDYPTLVGEVAKFNKLIIDDKKEYNLNVLSQHDNLFLLNESNSIKARALSTLIGINKLDNIIKETNLKLKQSKSERDKLIKQKEEITLNIQKYNDLSLLEQKLNKVLQLKKELDNKKELLQKYNLLSNEINFLNLKLEIFNKKYKQIDEQNIINLLNLITQLLELKNLNELVINLQNKVTNFNKSLKKVDINKLSKFDELSNILLNFYDLRDNLVERINLKINNHTNKFRDLLDKSDLIEEQLKQTLKELKICPICYKSINSDDIDEVIKHVLE